MFGSVQAFPMYGGLGMSTPSLHRESTDSLMIFTHFHSFFSSHNLLTYPETPVELSVSLFDSFGEYICSIDWL